MNIFPNRILDAHHHFWDLQGDGHYPWLQEDYNTNFFLGDYHKMLRTFLPRHYKLATRGFNVIGTIHVEAERSRQEEIEETLFLADLRLDNDCFPLAAVAHADFLDPDLDRKLHRHMESQFVRGIRCKPAIKNSPLHKLRSIKGTLYDPAWLAGLAQLEKYGLSWDLRVPWWHLKDSATILSDFPAVQVVLNHCGLPLDRSDEGVEGWRQGMEALSQLPNVMVKISELGLPGNKWNRASNELIVANTVSIFGYERCMFASNLPVGTLTAPSFEEIVKTVLAALPHASEDDIDKLFCRNAAHFYRINL